MNLFKKLFQKSQPTSEKSNLSSIPTDIGPDSFEDLFIDATPPSPRPDSKVKASKLSSFINEDLHCSGFNDGYMLHSNSVLDFKLKSVKADFRIIVDEIIDQKKSEVYSLKNQMIETAGISPNIQAQLENLIKEIQGNIIQLEREKELSVSDEGLVAKPLYSYKIGFMKGLEQYQAEKLMFQSTSIFN